MFILLGASNVVRMFNVHGFPDPCENLAVSGASVTKLPKNPHLAKIFKGYCSRLGSDLNSEATVILMAGTNDFLQRVPVETMRRDLKALLKVCARRFTRIVVGKVPPIPRHPELLNDIRRFNHWVDSLSSNRPNVKIADTFSIFLDPTNEGRILVRLFEETYHSGKRDRIHLNEEGLGMLKECLLEVANSF